MIPRKTWLLLCGLLTALSTLAQEPAQWAAWGLTRTWRAHRYGVRRAGKVLLPRRYQELTLFRDGYLLCKRPRGSYRILNLRTGEFFAQEYKAVDTRTNQDSLFHAGVCAVAPEDGVYSLSNWLLIRPDEQPVNGVTFEGIGHFYHGLARAQQNCQYGFINTRGQVVIPLVYDFIYDDFEDGFAAVREQDKQGAYNRRGQLVVPFAYDALRGYKTEVQHGLLALRQSGRWGFVDTTGRVVVPFRYESVHRFSEGLALVRLEHKYGFVDTTGQVAIPCEYDGPAYAEFHQGLVSVDRNDQVGFIDRQNQLVVPFRYYRLCPSDRTVHIGRVSARVNVAHATHTFDRHGYATVQGPDCRMGLIDRRGREVVPPQFHHVYVDEQGVIHVSDGQTARIFTPASHP